ncbi:MAG: glutaredoxin family protein, partial [Tepidiformaceae bacterium]
MADPEIVLYGTNWCGDCKRSKKFFGEQRVAYKFVDVDSDAEGLAVVERANNGKHIIPTIVFADGTT